MKRWLMAMVCGLCVIATSARANDAGDFFFKSGDRVLFLGDSITEQYQYSTYLELYVTTRFPRWNCLFLNAGIGGDTATGGANRFANHVLAEKPTALTINFGMNDAGYGAFDQNRNNGYVQNTEKMLMDAKTAGVRVALLSPNAVDRRVQERFKLYLETQKQFYAPLAGLASKHGATFVDQYAATRTVLETLEAKDAKSVIPFGDGFHTSPSGGLLMAYTILKGLKAPARVSDAEINIAQNSAKGQGCTISKSELSAKGVAFDRLDDALPLPIQGDWVSLLPFLNDLKDLNWLGLKVNGLAEGQYQLSIDGVDIAKFSAKELAEGVNLGNATKGPIFDQANDVFGAIGAKNGLVHQRFRGVVMFNAPDWLADVAAERKPKELERRSKVIQEKQTDVYQRAIPKTHRWKLTAL